MSNGRNEAFSRILIDKALEDSGWDLLNPQEVQFEFSTSGGRSDYLLKDNLGRVLYVLEAKREDNYTGSMWLILISLVCWPILNTPLIATPALKTQPI